MTITSNSLSLTLTLAVTVSVTVTLTVTVSQSVTLLVLLLVLLLLLLIVILLVLVTLTVKWLLIDLYCSSVQLIKYITPTLHPFAASSEMDLQSLQLTMDMPLHLAMLLYSQTQLLK